MKYMHMASIVSLKNGDLLASWQQAKEREGDWDQHIALALSKDAGGSRSLGLHQLDFLIINLTLRAPATDPCGALP